MATFASVVEAAESQRPGYAASTGFDASGSLRHIGLPAQLAEVYQYVVGTPGDIDEQQWMDLVPGHRLMLAKEIPECRDQLHAFYGEDDLFTVMGRTPFLADYSSDYYLTADDDSGVYWLDHESGASLVSVNMNAFWETVLRCYASGAYRIDEDGFLDLDDALECEIGRAVNPTCGFWEDG